MKYSNYAICFKTRNVHLVINLSLKTIFVYPFYDVFKVYNPSWIQ